MTVGGDSYKVDADIMRTGRAAACCACRHRQCNDVNTPDLAPSGPYSSIDAPLLPGFSMETH
jgi:hypothetical protein